eukprot:m.166235 g.166235  ORF g.166235 m.166235 type:complete len:107 (-) comp15239_c4_seq1:65-385(-)
MAAAAKLHAVTLVRSPIGKSATVKKTLEALGLTRMHKTTIHKNTPTVNGMLRTVIECVDVQPVKFEEQPSAAAPKGTTVFFDHTNTLRGMSEAAFKQHTQPLEKFE